MYRIDNPTSVPQLPTVPGPSTPGFFTNGQTAPPLMPTRVDDWWLNMVQEEILTVVTAAGLTPNKASTTQLYEAIQAIAYGSNPDLSAYLPLAGGILANPGNLTVYGLLTANSHANIGGNLTVNGEFTANSNLTALNLLVHQTATLQSHLLVGGNLTVDGDFAAQANLTALNLNVTGQLTAQSHADFAANVDIRGELNAESSANVAANFLVGGTITANTHLNVGANLAVNGIPFANQANFTVLCDPNLKIDIGPYEIGLAAVTGLNPIMFRYNGTHGTPADPETVRRIGLDARAAGAIMPELTTQRRPEEPEILTFDPGPLLYALLNAVKELAGRLDTLEDAGRTS